MARKVTPADQQGAAAGVDPAAAAAANELAVMRPDVSLTLSDQPVTVREYSFWDAMDIVYGQRGFLDDVARLLEDGAGDAWERVRAIFGRHRDYLRRAIALSTGQPLAWIDGLAPRELDALLSTWWAVNGHFFLHEATVVIRGRRAAKASAGPKSSPPSQPQGSDAPIASGTDTRGAS